MAEPFGGVLLAAYSVAGRLLTPAFPSILRARARRGHEDAARLGERYGLPSLARSERPVIWVHAASVGEANAVMPLIRRLVDRGFFVLLTTITVTGAATAAKALPAGAAHQYAPLDVRPWVRRFIGHWRPQLAIFVELEFWPVMTDQLVASRVPHVVVNARMSDRSFRQWRMLRRATGRVFGGITLALAQTEADASKLRELGIGRVELSGNLKFDAPPPSGDLTTIAALKRALGERPFWLAASTHPGEEEVVAEAHRRLAADHPDIVTAIVPRHPDRGPAIAAMLEERGLPVWLRSRDGDFPKTPHVMVADTLGELGVYYRVAPVSFIGGSLVPRGGQNPIEAIKLGSAVLHGPNMPNFVDIYAALDGAKGATMIDGPDRLAAEIARLLDDEPARERQVQAATAAIAPFSGALDRTMAALEPFLARRRGD